MRARAGVRAGFRSAWASFALISGKWMAKFRPVFKDASRRSLSKELMHQGSKQEDPTHPHESSGERSG